MRAEQILQRLGVTKNYCGYWILSDIIDAAIEDEMKLMNLSKLYNEAAAKYGKTQSAIEKSARTAVKRAWETSEDKIKKIARYSLYDRPSVGEFVEMTVNYILRHR